MRRKTSDGEQPMHLVWTTSMTSETLESLKSLPSCRKESTRARKVPLLRLSLKKVRTVCNPFDKAKHFLKYLLNPHVSLSFYITAVEPKKKSKASVDSGDAAKALQRAVSAFTGAAKGKTAQASDDYLGDMYDSKASSSKKSKPSAAAMDDDDSADDAHDMNDDYDAEEEEFDHGKKGGKRRRAPSGSMEEDNDVDEGEGLLEEFSRKKRDFAAKKKEHYAPEARYGGLIESVPESGKRAATYEIMKNKGLTPHRKKENRNPRVKKRQAYEKAIVRRKGQVREVTAGAAGSYDGELTGIKANIARSRKIGN